MSSEVILKKLPFNELTEFQKYLLYKTGMLYEFYPNESYTPPSCHPGLKEIPPQKIPDRSSNNKQTGQVNFNGI